LITILSLKGSIADYILQNLTLKVLSIKDVSANSTWHGLEREFNPFCKSERLYIVRNGINVGNIRFYLAWKMQL